MLHAARWKYRMQKLRKNSPSEHHRTTLSDCIFTIEACIDNQKKKLLNSNIFPIRHHNMANFGSLTAEICCQIWGIPANFYGFRVLASLLQRRCSPEANQTLHDVWPSLGLVHYICIFGGCCALTEFCPVHNSLYV